MINRNMSECNTSITDFKTSSLLYPNKFVLTFKRIPGVQYFCKKVSLPGIELGMVTQQTPFINKPLPGNKMSYTPFEISFMVDENMVSWEEIHNWLKDLGRKTGYQDYRALATEGNNVDPIKPQYSDATLTVLSVKNNPLMHFDFYDVFPLTLSAIVFDTELSPDEPVIIESSFGFLQYTLRRV